MKRNIILICIAFGLLGLAVYFFFVRPSAPGTFVAPITPSSTTNPLTGAAKVPDKFPNDADRDGISNADEKRLGLDPLEMDTDGDGLSDKNEIEVWHTDPKKVDTDGDKFADGQEVFDGYNPLGKGKRQ